MGSDHDFRGSRTCAGGAELSRHEQRHDGHADVMCPHQWIVEGWGEQSGGNIPQEYGPGSDGQRNVVDVVLAEYSIEGGRCCHVHNDIGGIGR